MLTSPLILRYIPTSQDKSLVARDVDDAVFRSEHMIGKTTRMPQADDNMELVVNGEPFDGHVTTLAELIGELGYGDQRVATAVNGDFVSGRDRETYELRDGDQIEVVAPRQGG